MISILFILIGLVVAALYIKANLVKTPDRFGGNDLKLPIPKLIVAIAIVLVSLLIAAIQPLSLERVDAGHVGIQVHLTGDSRGVGKFEYKTGYVVVNNWVNKLYEFPTFQQSIEYAEQAVITKGGFPVTIHPKFNYTLKPGDVGDMFSNLRLPIDQIEQKWLQNAIIGAFNDVVNKWTVDDIFNQRERFEADIVSEINKRVTRWFIISQLRTNIVPPPSLVQSIEAKTKAIQEVQVAENEAKVAIAQGDKKIATAKADSAQLVIGASAKAEAIKREQLSLTALYIDYLKTQKWNGVLPSVQAGSSGLMIQIPNK